MKKRVKEYTGFHNLLTEIQPYNSILSELNIFLKNYYTKSKINLLHTIYLECKIMNLLCVDFIVWFHRIYACRKNLTCRKKLDYTNSFFPNEYKKMTK